MGEFATLGTGEPKVAAANADTSTIRHYMTQLADCLNRAPHEAIEQFIEMLWDNYSSGRRVVFCGNGGSASTASHLPADFQKGIGLLGGRTWECLSIVDSIALVTAWSNDTSYDNALAAQARTWLRPGDILVAVSGSGNSPNVLAAVRAAKETGALTVGMSGFGGGILSELVDLPIVVNSHNMQIVEDAHMAIGHCAYTAIVRRVVAGNT